MRRRLLAVALLIAGALVWNVGDSIEAQGGPFMVYGPTSVSCGTFTASSGADRHALEWWVLGFVSGVNYARGGGNGPALADVDTKGQIGWITKYCAENPLAEFIEATTSLVEELERRGRPSGPR